MDEKNIAFQLANIPAERVRLAAILADKTGTTTFDAGILGIVNALDAKYDSLKTKDRDAISQYSWAHGQIAAALAVLRSRRLSDEEFYTTTFEDREGRALMSISSASHGRVGDADVPFYRQVVGTKWFETSGSDYHADVMSIIKDCDARKVIPPYAILVLLNSRGQANRRDWVDDLFAGNASYDAGVYDLALKYYRMVPKEGMGEFRVVDTYIAMGKFDEAGAACQGIEQDMDQWVAAAENSMAINLAIPLQGQNRQTMAKFLLERRGLIARKGVKPARAEFQGY